MATSGIHWQASAKPEYSLVINRSFKLEKGCAKRFDLLQKNRIHQYFFAVFSSHTIKYNNSYMKHCLLYNRLKAQLGSLSAME